MAIATSDAVDKFGTQDELTTTSSAVASDAFSVIADTGTWSNDDDVDRASVSFKGTLASAATSGASIDLYVRKMNVQSTDDDLEPGSTFKNEYLGSFPMIASTAQAFTVDIYLPNYKTSSEYDFYIHNASGQSLNSGWTLHITPKTVGPHA